MTVTPKQWAAFNDAWREEVAAVLASEGLPWVATACWCNQRDGARCIDVTHRATGKCRQLTIGQAHVESAATRRAEILRQLSG